MSQIKFIGNITTVSPVSVALPNVKGMPRNTHNSAYIPSSSIRGMLRHVAHFALATLLEEKKETLTVDQHYMLASGVDTARKLKLGGGYETIGKNHNVRKNNPLISLFGNFTVAGNLKVGNAIAAPNEDVIIKLGNGSRNHPFNRSNQLLGFVAENELGYLQDVMNADALASLEINEIKAEIALLTKQNRTATPEEKKFNIAKIDEYNKQIDSTKDSRVGSSEAIKRPLDGFEAIDEGVTLSHRMRLSNASSDEVAFLFWVLHKASTNFSIGGHENLGCGEVHAEWIVTESSFETITPKQIGTVKIDDNGVTITGFDFDYARFEQYIIDGKFDFTVY